MQNTIAINRKNILSKALITLIAVAGAVILPQIFHGIGTISGTGPAMGSALLPMHIPVLLAGFLGGPLVGAAAGVLSPLVSSAVSGMPSALILPFMVLELGVYGLVSGLLSRRNINSLAALLLTQLIGRAVRAAAVLAAVLILGNEQLTIASAYSFVLEGLFGILLQWALIPPLTKQLKELVKKHD
ncbi:MAG: ECF transporter S component [Ruminococcus sp.]|nr:ECF transporter S component [Ruminococcus sp.]